MEFGLTSASRVLIAGDRHFTGAAIARRLSGQALALVTGTEREHATWSDADAVEAAFAEARPTHVFLCGGLAAGILGNQRFPATLIRDNLLVNTLVIEAARRHGVERLLYLASSCVYPKLAPQPMTPSSLVTGPFEPTNAAYATAKLAGLMLVQAYRREYGCRYISVIPANLYGPGEDMNPEDAHVIPALMHRMHAARESNAAHIEIWGTGQARREFVYIDDVADACVFLMERYDADEPVNAGGGVDLSIAELAAEIRNVVGFAGELRFDRSKPDGMPFKGLDSSVLLGMGWRPSMSLPEALRRTYSAALSSTGTPS
jgi:GDP-L-fucose synthase